jgi:hypothetical protein
MIHVLSPVATTIAGKWTVFVCRVHFTTTVANTRLRIAGGVIVLSPSGIYLTSALCVGKLDIPLWTANPSDGSPICQDNTLDVYRGDADIDTEYLVANTGEHFVDVTFWDVDQNTNDGQPATQVWAALSYAGENAGSGFTVDYTHGWDNSGNNPATAWEIAMPN